MVLLIPSLEKFKYEMVFTKFIRNPNVETPLTLGNQEKMDSVQNCVETLQKLGRDQNPQVKSNKSVWIAMGISGDIKYNHKH